MPMTDEECQANFLWPHEDGSIEQAGYEFANGRSEEWQQEWWATLQARIIASHAPSVDVPKLPWKGHFEAGVTETDSDGLPSVYGYGIYIGDRFLQLDKLCRDDAKRLADILNHVAALEAK